MLGVADKVVEAVKSGAIKHFFLMGGCDGAAPGRNYYTDFAEQTPSDTVMPVSYTHLDVYKRQGLGCIAMWRRFPDQLAAATGRRVIAWSRAGYGASQPRATPRTPRYLHEEALEALPEDMF